MSTLFFHTIMGRRQQSKKSRQNVHVLFYILTSEDIEIAGEYLGQYKSAEVHEKIAILGDTAEDMIAGIESVAELTKDERDNVILAVHNFILSECPGTVEDAMGMWFRDWTLKSVVEFERKDEIRERIPVSDVMRELSNKEQEKFALQASKWNDLGAPAVVKSQLAEKRVHKMMVSYVNRCRDKLGIEVVILYGFRTPTGQVEAYVTNSNSPKCFSKVYPKFLSENCKPFLDFCNITINGEVEPIPEGAAGRNKKSLAVGKDVPVPWVEVAVNPETFFHKKWLPRSKCITDPSKMHLADMVEILERIHDDPADSFNFTVGDAKLRSAKKPLKGKRSKASKARKGQDRMNRCQQSDPDPMSDGETDRAWDTDDEEKFEAALRTKIKKKPYVPSDLEDRFSSNDMDTGEKVQPKSCKSPIELAAWSIRKAKAEAASRAKSNPVQAESELDRSAASR
ncbi:hypothetical protein JAAARDRAFT_200860 [Jaapia argillacea MUCL 33604]|uniref:Uncharacterized protein n=1 Tax=Jaapia argillacea MUCL 33604 TaxID=933084 RepID=A0A067P3G5_9AGAM|nr:hypothetical protein JAAARDRAFT_200860 [Jaapia argillacea MUCL 33604]